MGYDQIVAEEFLTRANRVVLDNLDNGQFDVTAMAREMGMSRASLYRRIKSSSGDSPTGYIRGVKLEKARELLLESSDSITEIAFECGFRSLAYFDACFSRHYHVSPGALRKNYRSPGDQHPVLVGIQASTPPEREKQKAGEQLHHFPVPATRFIGRRKEMEAIRELVHTSRMVSLVGPGGCGKTRLACETVALLRNGFKDGIWFVNLAPLEKGEMVVKQIMEALRIAEAPASELMETLLQWINSRELLLVLDNCEHLAASCAKVAGRLIRSVPGLKILATSRASLGIEGEHVFSVPAMSLVDPGNLKTVSEAMSAEAVQLFTDRSHTVDHRFALSEANFREVAAICKMVDGIPLALELVASRIRFMDPAKIVERFSERYTTLVSSDPGTIGRHTSLAAAFDWSFQLLTTEEKLLFGRLGVFSGGFSLNAVENVCGDKRIPVEYILELLANLVDRSMVSTIREGHLPMRYTLLEPLRQYAVGQMDARETNRARRRHLDYFTGMAQQAYDERLLSQATWMNRLSLERDNLMAALHWAEQNSFSRYAKLMGLLAWFWARSNNLFIARQRLGSLVGDRRIKNENRARILIGYGWSLAGQVDMYASLGRIVQESMEIWQRLGQLEEQVILRTDMAALYFGTGNDAAAVHTIMETYAMAQKLDNRGVLLYCMMYVSMGHVVLRKFREARKLIREILELADEMGNVFAAFAAHHNLGDCALMEGNFEEAAREYGEGIRITMQFGDMHYLYTDLMGIAMAVAGLGNYARALRLTGGINANTKKAGITSPEYSQISFWKEQVKVHIAGTREKLGEPLSRKYEAEGAAMEMEEVINYALDGGSG